MGPLLHELQLKAKCIQVRFPSVTPCTDYNTYGYLLISSPSILLI